MQRTCPADSLTYRLLPALGISLAVHLGIWLALGQPPIPPPMPLAKKTFTVEAINPQKLGAWRMLGFAAAAATTPPAAPALKFTPTAALEDQVVTRAAQKALASHFALPEQVGLAASFLPPPDLPQDELNTLEDKFYSFKRRVNQYYISTFLQTYQHHLLAYPKFDEHLATLDPQELSGRLTYDQEGNLVALQVQNWSSDEPLENLFESVLGKLTTIQNIPQEFLNHEQQLVIYYHFVLL